MQGIAGGKYGISFSAMRTTREQPSTFFRLMASTPPESVDANSYPLAARCSSTPMRASCRDKPQVAAFVLLSDVNEEVDGSVTSASDEALDEQAAWLAVGRQTVAARESPRRLVTRGWGGCSLLSIRLVCRRR